MKERRITKVLDAGGQEAGAEGRNAAQARGGPGPRTAMAVEAAGSADPRPRRGIKVVSLEPTCMAVLRADAPELLPDGQEARLPVVGTRAFSASSPAGRSWQR